MVVHDGSAIRLWDLEKTATAQPPTIVSSPEEAILRMAISGAGHWLVAGGSKGAAYIWKLTAGTPSPTPTVLASHGGEIRNVAMSPDERWLVVVGDDGPCYRGGDVTITTHLWNLSLDGWAALPPLVVSENKRTQCSEPETPQVTFSYESHWLVITADNGAARLWDLTADKAIDKAPLSFKGLISAIAISPNNYWLIIAGGEELSENGYLHVWDLQTGEFKDDRLHFTDDWPAPLRRRRWPGTTSPGTGRQPA